MKINYYFRNKQAGYSIGGVFDTICQCLAQRTIIKKTYLPSPFANVSSIFKNGWFAKNQETKGYINHITGDVHYLLYFLKSSKTIVTVHDIMYYHYLHGIKRKLWYYIYISPLKRAAFVTFISEFACQQVLNEIALDKNKIRIIPNPVDESFIYAPTIFNDFKPTVLHIGTLERKNLKNTVKALKGISCHLRIIGELSEEQKKLLFENLIDFSSVSDLSHSQIVDEYRKADIVNFPSLFEGFGMPIIEAQAIGRIVVTSTISPMKEVAGEGAVLVDPYSVEDIRKAYLKIISRPQFRDDIIHKGTENVKRFSVNTIANQYQELYRILANEENS